MQQYVRLILLSAALGLGTAAAQQPADDSTPPTVPSVEGQQVAVETETTGTVKVMSQKEKQALAQTCRETDGAAKGCRQLGR